MTLYYIAEWRRRRLSRGLFRSESGFLNAVDACLAMRAIFLCVVVTSAMRAVPVGFSDQRPGIWYELT